MTSLIQNTQKNKTLEYRDCSNTCKARVCVLSGPPSENPGPWAERSRALSYRAVTGPIYIFS